VCVCVFFCFVFLFFKDNFIAGILYLTLFLCFTPESVSDCGQYSMLLPDRRPRHEASDCRQHHA
jgi:hypothetical protein